MTNIFAITCGQRKMFVGLIASIVRLVAISDISVVNWSPVCDQEYTSYEFSAFTCDNLSQPSVTYRNPRVTKPLIMSMVIKGMIRITNEDRQLLSSLAILIIPLTARLINKRNPRVGMQAYCPNYCRIFFCPKSETFFWKEIVITEE